MTTRIGLISDIHSTVAPLQEALDIFQREQVDMIICAGDTAGYGEDELSESIELLKQHQCKVIIGNHDHPPEDLTDKTQIEQLSRYFDSLPNYLSFDIEGKSIYLVHAQPPDLMHGGIKLLDPDGHVLQHRKDYWQQQLKDFDYNILIVGHTHQVFAETIASTLVINPGSTKYNHTCMILTLPSMQVETFSLSGKEPILTWNWGKFYKEQHT